MPHARWPAVLALLASLVAIVPSHAQPPSALRIGIRDDPDLLDPTFSRTYVGTVVMTALCDKLFDFDATLNIVPMLATGYEWTDSKTLLIHLRPNVQFQDGEKFDAAAVKYTLERDLTATGSFRRSEIGAMDHVEVVDPLTVRVVMKQPFSPFIAVLTDRAGMMVAPKSSRFRRQGFRHASGLRRPVPLRRARRAGPHHGGALSVTTGMPARIHYDRVIYHMIPDSSIRLTNLQAGSLDIAEVAPLDAATVQHDPKLRLVSVRRASATAR